MATFSQHTTIYVDPIQVDTFWQKFKPVFEHIATAPGCLYVEVFEDPAIPGKITWVSNLTGDLQSVLSVRA